MSDITAADRQVDGARARQFLRFCVVGGVGFAVDSSVLLAAVHVGGVDPIVGRFLSFALAVWVTFELNRRWAFQAQADLPQTAAFARYLVVQGLGFAFNFGIYTLLYVMLPRPYNAPLLCLSIGSAAALIANYLGARFIVFRTRQHHGSAI